MIKIGRLIIVLLLLWSVGVLADQKEKGKKVIFKKSETHVFSGLKLKGEYKKPDLSYIYQRKGIRSEQIIDIPDDFNREIREDGNHF